MMDPNDGLGFVFGWIMNHYILVGSVFLVAVLWIRLSSINPRPDAVTYDEASNSVSADPEDGINDTEAFNIKIICPETKELIYSDRAKADDFDHDAEYSKVDYYRFNDKRVILFTGRNLVVIEEA